MTDPNASPKFDEHEFALILRKAAELQERDAARPARTGLTLGEIESIAVEAGIAADYVRRAVATIERPEPTLWRRVAGHPTRIQEQHVLPGELGPEALAAIIDRLQAALGNPGVARDALGGVEWTAKDSFGKVHMIARPMAGETRVRLAADRSETAAVLVTLLPILGIVAGGALFSVIEVLPGAVWAGVGLTGGLVAARALWSRITTRWQTRLRQLMNDVLATVESTQLARDDSD